MKIVLISVVILQAMMIFHVLGRNERKLLNMANTVSPIIQQISERLGEYKNTQISTPAKGGQLIYKREPSDSCISGIGNWYYIRVYEWDYENGKLWNKPIQDVPLNCSSCIAEKEIIIPYSNKVLQNASLGIKFYR